MNISISININNNININTNTNININMSTRTCRLLLCVTSQRTSLQAPHGQSHQPQAPLQPQATLRTQRCVRSCFPCPRRGRALSVEQRFQQPCLFATAKSDFKGSGGRGHCDLWSWSQRRQRAKVMGQSCGARRRCRQACCYFSDLLRKADEDAAREYFASATASQKRQPQGHATGGLTTQSLEMASIRMWQQLEFLGRRQPQAP